MNRVAARLLFAIAMLTAARCMAAVPLRFQTEFGTKGVGGSLLSNPWRMAADPRTGDIAIADSSAGSVAIFSQDGSYERRIGATAGPRSLLSPCAVAYLDDGQKIMVSDAARNSLLVFDRAGMLLSVISTLSGTQTTSLSRPCGLAVGRNAIYVADIGHDRVLRIDRPGHVTAEFGGQGNQDGRFNLPYDVALSPDGRTLAVADYGNSRVQLFDSDGRHRSSLGHFGHGIGEFWGASGVAFDSDGLLYVADAANRRIQWLGADGRWNSLGRGGTAPGQFLQPHAVLVHPVSGVVYVSDFYANRVQAFGPGAARPRSFPITKAWWLVGLLFLIAWAALAWLDHSRSKTGRKALRPQVAQWAFAMLVATAIAVVFNRALWAAAAASGTAIAAGMLLLLASLLFCILVLCPRSLVKPVAFVLLTVAAICQVFMWRYRVYMDADMLRNLLNTNLAEATGLLRPGLLMHMTCQVILALLPVALLRVDTRAHTPRARIAGSATAVLAALVAALWLPASARVRKTPQLIWLINPVSPFVSLVQAANSRTTTGRQTLTPVAMDAKRAVGGGKPRLLVFVMGESTRAASWGLNPGAPATTPQLSRMPGIINFSDVRACGSNTLTSVPCIFSPWGRRDYDANRISRSENLLHVLARVGYAVDWIEVGGDCMGVCRGLPSISLREPAANVICQPTGCLDGDAVAVLQRILNSAPARDRLIAVHTIGSHGPDYGHRYPPPFELFRPVCTSDDIQACSPQSLQNSYNNTVVYADHVLASIIRAISADHRYDAALIYTSDHGESLGEEGLYMHGTPYAIAPDTQMKVPLVLWASDTFLQRNEIDRPCMQRASARPISHDWLFSSVLSALQVTTSVYDPKLDVFDTCRVGHGNT